MSLSNLYKTSASLPQDALPPVGGLHRRLLRLPAWSLPAGLILTFGALFALVFRDRLVPAVPVSVVPAILMTEISQRSDGGADNRAADGHDAGKRMLFQAGGWFEPDPLPIYAIALLDGVISKVHVLEGQEVKTGQRLAELISDDAKIALDAAERAHDRATAELRLQQAQVGVAEAEVAAMADQVKVGEAKLAEERDNQTRIARMPAGAVSDQDRSKAKFVVDGQTAEVAARKSQHTAAVAKVEAARAQATALEAGAAAALVEVDKNKLALSRTRINSPVDGVILELHAAPGQKKLRGLDDHQSATIATLYERGRLQARVDVPLADARGMTVGQEAVITSDYLPNVEFRGVVSRIVGTANLQRNTLQAKVRVIDPDPRLRPEMLCRVKFLSNQRTESTDRSSNAVASNQREDSDPARVIMVPEAALVARTEDRASLWIVAPDGSSASMRSAKVGSFTRDNYMAITSGVLAGELVILPPHDRLADGRRVRPNIIPR